MPRVSARDTAGVAADVLLPFAARGAIVRRPRVVDLLDRMDADDRAVRRLQRLRSTYGEGPLLLRIPGRELALVLSPEHVQRVLDGSPDPFAAANVEKRAALERFQPHGVLVSHGPERAERRRFNEEVLDSSRPVHGLADEIVAKVADEADALVSHARRAGALTWPRFAPAWWRMVRRVVLGDAAREDRAVTDELTRLRGDANWSYLAPRRRELRERFLARIRHYVERAEPGSLASLVASTPSDAGTFPVEQVPQWLFAFDAAGMASFRALALLDSHPEEAERVHAEIAEADLAAPHDLARARASVLESVRLWPTTPAVLRDTTQVTDWNTGTLPAGAGILIFSSFFHRDDERLPYADRFEPDLWPGGRRRVDWPLIPFSEGPVECPGRNLVLLTTSTLIANLLARAPLRQSGGKRPSEQEPLPRTLSPFRLVFTVG